MAANKMYVLEIWFMDWIHCVLQTVNNIYLHRNKISKRWLLNIKKIQKFSNVLFCYKVDIRTIGKIVLPHSLKGLKWWKYIFLFFITAISHFDAFLKHNWQPQKKKIIVFFHCIRLLGLPWWTSGLQLRPSTAGSVSSIVRFLLC